MGGGDTSQQERQAPGIRDSRTGVGGIGTKGPSAPHFPGRCRTKASSGKEGKSRDPRGVPSGTTVMKRASITPRV